MSESYFQLRQLLAEAPKKFEGKPLRALPSFPDPRDYKYSRLVAVTGDAPQTIDYRPNLPAVFDQGNRGSCVACAAAWTVKAVQELAQGDYPVGGLSAAFLYSLCKQNDGIPNQEGTYPRVAMKMLQQYGVCPEELLPYHMLTDLAEPNVPVISASAKSAASLYKIQTYAQLCGADTDRTGMVEIWRTALKREGPFMAALLVCDNFVPDGEFKLPIPSGRIRGGHAVGIVGDLPDQESFILRNSWGKEWGKDGYALLPYKWLTSSYDPWGDGKKAWYIFEAWTAVDIVVLKTAKRIEIMPGASSMLVDDVGVMLDAPATIVNGRIELPLRAVGNNMGYMVSWDGSKAILTKPN